ncbi:MAG: hypothetical protein J7559_15745, partial [Cohnella sp.]|nr:hypothetical protein [Cohnella sp.]
MHSIPNKQKKRKWLSCWLAVCLAVALGFPAIGASPAHADPADWMENFEYANTADLNAHWTGVDLATDPAYVKEGGASVKWYNTHSRKTVKTQDMPEDWSQFDHLQFWAYSVQATGDNSYIFIDTNDPATEGYDYFLYSYKIDWTGWKKFDLPLNGLLKVRQASWSHVHELRFTSMQYATDTPSPQTVLYFDALKVYHDLPPQLQAVVTDPGIKQAARGETLDYTVRLTNKGVHATVYEMQVPSEWSGSMTAEPASGTLAPVAFTDIHVA